MALGCGSGWIRVWALAGFGSCDGCGLGFGMFGRSGARLRVRWRPSASGLFGVFSGGAWCGAPRWWLVGLVGQRG